MIVNLGRWEPSQYITHVIKDEIIEFLFYNGFEGIADINDVRDPAWHAFRRTCLSIADEWHQDELCWDDGGWIAVWSTINPTEIQDQLTPLPFDVTVFTNADYYHRRPVMSENDDNERWFARIFCADKWSRISDV